MYGGYSWFYQRPGGQGEDMQKHEDISKNLSR